MKGKADRHSLTILQPHDAHVHSNYIYCFIRLFLLHLTSVHLWSQHHQLRAKACTNSPDFSNSRAQLMPTTTASSVMKGCSNSFPPDFHSLKGGREENPLRAGSTNLPPLTIFAAVIPE